MVEVGVIILILSPLGHQLCTLDDAGGSKKSAKPKIILPKKSKRSSALRMFISANAAILLQLRCLSIFSIHSP
jgi:hypothetical protein